MDNNKTIEYDYIVGADRNIREVLKCGDLLPLFESAALSGASYIALEEADGYIICRYGNISDTDSIITKTSVYLEGEVAGYVVIMGNERKRDIIRSIGSIIHEATDLIIKSNLKALLAVETHKTVVHQSYEELIETNRKLTLSESKYRELAANLEKQVQERTEDLKKAHTKLLTQEKIASIGQLAAGIAHEINNPLGFVLSNINTLKQYVSKMKEMLILYRDASATPGADATMLDEKWKKYKLDFIFSDTEELIKESISGAERVKKIVSDLKGFSHIDEAKEIEADINNEIDRTLNVLIHETPRDAEIVKDYQLLPLFACNPADICQAFFNIILNAFQIKREGLRLAIATRCIGEHILIIFSDNGPGMTEEIKRRIFEPFFTTKEVGMGTGMGLNVAYEIVASYGGTIEVESRPGEGAQFSILLPVKKA